MSSKTKSGETSGENIRMVCAVFPDTPEPLQLQLGLRKNIFPEKLDFPGSLTSTD